jgi:hypothetical protein
MDGPAAGQPPRLDTSMRISTPHCHASSSRRGREGTNHSPAHGPWRMGERQSGHQGRGARPTHRSSRSRASLSSASGSGGREEPLPEHEPHLGGPGRPNDYLGNEFNTGFFFVVTSSRTVALFDEWHAWRNQSAGMKEEDMLNQMKRQGAFGRLVVRARPGHTSLQRVLPGQPGCPAGGHRARQLLPEDECQGCGP